MSKKVKYKRRSRKTSEKEDLRTSTSIYKLVQHSMNTENMAAPPPPRPMNTNTARSYEVPAAAPASTQFGRVVASTLRSQYKLQLDDGAKTDVSLRAPAAGPAETTGRAPRQSPTSSPRACPTPSASPGSLLARLRAKREAEAKSSGTSVTPLALVATSHSFSAFSGPGAGVSSASNSKDTMKVDNKSGGPAHGGRKKTKKSGGTTTSPQESTYSSGGLNREQLEAALSPPDRPLLVKAGAGTGKTTLVVRRLEYFMREKQIPPERILCLSYTNTAAEEMRERVTKKHPDAAGKLMLCTIHKLANMIVSAYWTRLDADFEFKSYLDVAEREQSEKQEDLPAAAAAQRAGARPPAGPADPLRRRRKYAKKPLILTADSAREPLVKEGLMEYQFEVGRREMLRYLFEEEAKAEKWDSKSWGDLLLEARKKHPELFRGALDRSVDAMLEDKKRKLKDPQNFDEWARLLVEKHPDKIMDTDFVAAKGSSSGPGFSSAGSSTAAGNNFGSAASGFADHVPARAPKASKLKRHQSTVDGWAPQAQFGAPHAPDHENSSQPPDAKQQKPKRRLLKKNSSAASTKSTAKPPVDYFTNVSPQAFFAKAEWRRHLRQNLLHDLRWHKNPRLARAEEERMKKRDAGKNAINFAAGIGPREPAQVMKWIDLQKTRGLAPTAFAKDTAERFAYDWYMQQMERQNGMDFQDILWNAHWLLSNFEDVKKAVGGRFSYVVVDEFQDTSVVQLEMLEMIVPRRITAVGDSDQLIMTFAGSHPNTFDRFRDNFGGPVAMAVDSDNSSSAQNVHEVRLKENYRCTDKILAVARSVLDRRDAAKLDAKAAWGDSHEPVRVWTAQDPESEAEKIAKEIRSIVEQEQDGEYSDFAILLRSFKFGKVQPRTYTEFEKAFTRKGHSIPYQILGDVTFLEKPAALDLFAYLGLCANKSCDPLFWRVFNEPPRGMGPVFVDYLKAEQQARGGSLYDASWRLLKDPDVDSSFMTPMYRRGLQAFVDLLDEGEKLLQDQEQSSSSAASSTPVVQLAPHELMCLVLEKTEYLSKSSHVPRDKKLAGAKRKQDDGSGASEEREEDDDGDESQSSGTSGDDEDDGSVGEDDDAASTGTAASSVIVLSDDDPSPSAASFAGTPFTAKKKLQKRDSCASAKRGVPGSAGRAARSSAKKFGVGGTPWRDETPGRGGGKKNAGDGATGNQDTRPKNGAAWYKAFRTSVKKKTREPKNFASMSDDEQKLWRRQAGFSKTVLRVVAHAEEFCRIATSTGGEGADDEMKGDQEAEDDEDDDDKKKPAAYFTGEDALREYLGTVNMDSTATTGNKKSKKAARPRVTISTIHRAKGKEWKYVFIPHFNEGFLPAAARADRRPQPTKGFSAGREKKKPAEAPTSDELDTHYAEECRLMHVAVTRAKLRCYVVTLKSWGDGSVVKEADVHPSSINLGPAENLLYDPPRGQGGTRGGGSFHFGGGAWDGWDNYWGKGEGAFPPGGSGFGYGSSASRPGGGRTSASGSTPRSTPNPNAACRSKEEHYRSLRSLPKRFKYAGDPPWMAAAKGKGTYKPTQICVDKYIPRGNAENPDFYDMLVCLRLLAIDAESWLNVGRTQLVFPPDDILQKAYRLRAREVHPDKVGGLAAAASGGSEGAAQDEAAKTKLSRATEDFKAMKNAYDKIVEHVKKKRDQQST